MAKTRGQKGSGGAERRRSRTREEAIERKDNDERKRGFEREGRTRPLLQGGWAR